MIHAREDYNRIQDPAGLIPVDEPVFLLRAQDLLAPTTVRRWAELLREAANGYYADGNMTDGVAAHDMATVAEDHADAMERYAETHQCKTPDMARATPSNEVLG